MTRSGFTLIELLVVMSFCVLLALLVCGGVFTIPVYLLFGWIGYLCWALTHIDGLFVAVGLCALATTLLAGHLVLRLLAVRHWQLPRWRWVWTSQCMGLVLALVWSPLCVSMIARDVVWLAKQDYSWTYNLSSHRPQATRNIHNIGLASQDWAASNGGFLPVSGVYDETGRPLHGWETLLLPLLDQESLFARIDLTIPWDDARQQHWFKTQIDVFQNPAWERVGNAHTFTDAAGLSLQHFAMNVRLVDGRNGLDLDTISRADRLSKTILLGEAGGKFQPWGKPGNWRDPASGINISPDGFGSPDPEACFVFADGHVKTINEDIDPRVLRALATPMGGETVWNEDF